jgi:ActR/RegA family two-component response regulator/anti-sigma regulatory factor (Ser/Thr protein kinase)
VREEPLQVLIVEGEEPVTEALSTTLARRGHRVSTAASAEVALAAPASDVIVCEGRLPGSCGFDLLAAVRKRGDDARFVILLGDPTVEECLRALRLGAHDLLAKPFRIEDLVRAVEGRGDPRAVREGGREGGRPAGRQGGQAGGRELSSTPARDPAVPDVFERSYPPTRQSVELCARELCAFAILRGVPPSVRARIACAAEEIAHNVLRHGRLPRESTFQVRARIDGETFHLRIADPGVGFDARRVLGPGPGGPARSGIQRARSLSERLSLCSKPGAGTEVDLCFSTSGAALAADGRDLSEVDFLALGEAEALIGELLEGRTPDIEALSPALAVVLGRLLAGPGKLGPERDPALP